MPRHRRISMSAQIIPFTTETDWLAARRQDVTSTESAALFGMSPYMTAFELWHRKQSGAVPAFQSNERMQWGSRLEAAIAHGIAQDKGWQIRPMKEYMRLPNERIGSSFDFMITNLPGGPAHLEIKNVDFLAFRDGWIIDGDSFDEAPEHIEVQVQHQMMVSGFTRSFIGALVGGNTTYVIERQRDDAVIATLKSRIAKFWTSVDANDEPAPVMPQDADAVIRLNQYANPGKILDVSGDAEIVTMVQQYRQSKRDADAAEERSKVIKAELMVRLGDAEKILGDSFSISAGMIADTPPTIITPEMVGTEYGGRKGYRMFRVNSKKSK